MRGSLTRLFWFALKVLPSYLVFAVANLVPKRRQLWLFGAWMGRKYSDNPKYLLRYVAAHEPGIQAVWITKDKALVARLRAEGIAAEYAYGLRGMWLQLRTELVVFTHSVPDEYLSPLIARRVRRVQTWHGIPIKKIGRDDNTQQYSRAHLLVRALLYPCDLDRCDLVIAAGDADAQKYRTAFSVRASDICITGYPRNDELLRSVKVLAKQGGPRRAIYMPTFRGSVGSEFALFRTTRFDFRAADECLGRIGWRLTMKLHPMQRLSTADEAAIAGTTHIDALPAGMDTYDFLGGFDAVITDFSGIYFDFMITGKPIIMAPFDIDVYLANDRELYYPYEELCPDEPCREWGDVFARLASLPPSGSAPTPRYAQLQSRFHAHLDDGASARTVAAMWRLVGAG